MRTTLPVKKSSATTINSRVGIFKICGLIVLLMILFTGCSEMKVAGDWKLLKMEKEGKVLFDFSNDGEAIDNFTRHMEASAMDEAELQRILDRSSLQNIIGTYRVNFFRLNVDHSFRSKSEILSPTIPYYAALTNDVSGHWKYNSDDGKLTLTTAPGKEVVYTVKVDGNQMKLINDSNVIITLVE